MTIPYDLMDDLQGAVTEKILRGDHIDYTDLDVCNTIVEASILWTTENEKEHPVLKKARELASYRLRQEEMKGDHE